MGFADPAGPEVVTVVGDITGSVDLNPGASVVTDPSSAANVLVNESGGAYAAGVSRRFPDAVTTYYCGDFDVLQLAFAPTLAPAGFDCLIEWFSGQNGGAAELVGKTQISTPDTTACIQAFPVMGPYLRITVTPGPAVSAARLFAHLRKGGIDRSFTAGANANGNLFGNTFGALVPAAGNFLFIAETIVGGPAVLGIYSDDQSWLGAIYAYTRAGVLAVIGGFDVSNASRTRRADSWRIALPYQKVGVRVFNTAGAAANIYASLIPT